MRPSFMLRGFGFLLGLFAFAGFASAQSGETSFSLGYSHFHPAHDGGLFFDKDGGYFDADFAWRVPYYRSPLLFGVGITGSGYFESQSVPVPLNNNIFGTASLDSNVGLLEIEPRLAYEIWLPGLRGIFVKPRIGAGLLINNYSVDNQSTINGNTFFGTQNFTGVAFEVRPAVQAGYSWGPGSMGIELSYLGAWGGFGRFGTSADEFRAGAFFTFRF